VDVNKYILVSKKIGQTIILMSLHPELEAMGWHSCLSLMLASTQET
jgi:hypothetical protein